MFWTIYAKWCKLSKYTNPECCALFQCRLYLFPRRKNFFGVFVSWLYLVSFCVIFSDVVFIRNFTRKKIGAFCHRDMLNNGHSTKSINRFFTGGVFCHRDIFNQGDFILHNRSIAFFQGSFWFRVFCIRIVLYELINQQQKTKGWFDLGYLDPGG